MFIVPTCTYQYSVANTPSWSIDDSPWVKQLSHDLKNTPSHRKTDFDPGDPIFDCSAIQRMSFRIRLRCLLTNCTSERTSLYQYSKMSVGGKPGVDQQKLCHSRA